jgi:poly(3-hydroxyalkanoate) depolymerase
VSVRSPERDTDLDSRLVDADGLRIRTAVRGHGPPILLIMGIGGNLEMWGRFETSLRAHGLQTITYDAPGTGHSSGYRLPRRVPGLARTIEHLLDALEYDRVDVLGVSFGGGVAQQLAHQAPTRIRRLVLAATMPGVGGIPGRPRALLAMATPRRYFDPNYYLQIAGRLYGGEARRNPERSLDDSAARFIRPPSWGGYLAQLYAIPGWSSIPWLRSLPHPTLVLGGDDDPIVPLANARILACLIPNARLHVVAGGGHLFVLERADEIAGIVADFVTSRSHTANPENRQTQTQREQGGAPPV